MNMIFLVDGDNNIGVGLQGLDLLTPDDTVLLFYGKGQTLAGLRRACANTQAHIQYLESVREALKVQLYPDGTLRDLAEGTDLSPETVVSMNFWGFAPSIFPALREYFENFLRTEAGENIKAECLLPVFVDKLMHEGELTVPMLTTDAVWFGVTYKEDKPFVQAELRKLHESGVYPASLHE